MSSKGAAGIRTRVLKATSGFVLFVQGATAPLPWSYYMLALLSVLQSDQVTLFL
jgi:hypothetical protein